MAKQALIKLEKLNKGYPLADSHIPVLHDVCLDIYTGDIIAILGASGSGKSTLMNIIGLLDTADSGQYWLDGENVTLLDEDTQALRRNRTMGFVFQQFNLLPRLNAFQNVALPLQYGAVSKNEVEARVMEALTKVHMQDYTRHLPSQLSGGQQQRIAIARALVNQPDIILADEPTGALDSKTGDEVMQLFHQLHQEGRTVVMITHDPAIARQCAKRVHIADGRLQEEAVHEFA